MHGGGCNLKILIIIENIMRKYLSIGVEQSSLVSLKFPRKWIFIYDIVYNFNEIDKRSLEMIAAEIRSLSRGVITARLTGISAREKEIERRGKELNIWSTNYESSASSQVVY